MSNLLEIGVNLSGSAGAILSVEVQAGGTAGQQDFTQLGGDLDPHLPHLIIVFRDRGYPISHQSRQFGTAQLRKALDLSHVGDRHDAGNDRNVAAQGPNPVEKLEVVLSSEE